MSKRGSYEGWRAPETEQLVRLWQAGYTSYQIAERLGKSRGAIMGKVSRLGLIRNARRRPIAATDQPTQLRNHRLFADYLGGMTRAECAVKYGLSLEGVKSLLSAHGIKLPPHVYRERLSEWSKRSPKPGRPRIWPDCPEHLRDEYKRLRNTYGYRAGEARAILEQAMAV